MPRRVLFSLLTIVVVVAAAAVWLWKLSSSRMCVCVCASSFLFARIVVKSESFIYCAFVSFFSFVR